MVENTCRSRCLVCSITTGAFGDHQVCCRGNGDLIHHHDSLSDALFSAAQSKKLATLDVTVIFLVPPMHKLTL